MTVDPGYGDTPVPDDDAVALQPRLISIFGAAPLKADIYELEQSIQDEVAAELLADVLAGGVAVTDLVQDRFLVDLHRRLYSDVWSWGGSIRRRELNIGIAPDQIAVHLRSSLESCLYRWQHTTDWTAREFAIALHAEAARIHPFVDGNGRTTRLLADLVFVAAQDVEDVQLFDWDVDKVAYIQLLREYDENRDPRRLAAFIATQSLGV